MTTEEWIAALNDHDRRSRRFWGRIEQGVYGLALAVIALPLLVLAFYGLSELL